MYSFHFVQYFAGSIRLLRCPILSSALGQCRWIHLDINLLYNYAAALALQKQKDGFEYEPRRSSSANYSFSSRQNKKSFEAFVTAETLIVYILEVKSELVV